MYICYAGGEVMLDAVHCDGGEQEEEATREYLGCHHYHEWHCTLVVLLLPYCSNEMW